MNEIQGGLPPRSSRGTQRKSGRVSFKRVIQGGLILFGALFFGLIGLELYHAQGGSQSAVPNQSVDSEAKPSVDSAAHEEQQPPAHNTEELSQTPVTDSDQGEAPATPAVTTPVTTLVTDAVTETTATPSAEQASAPQEQATSPEPAAAQPKTVKHVVVKGDTLFKLSRQYYGNNSGASRIASYNGLAADAQLRIGTVVTIPLSR